MKKNIHIDMYYDLEWRDCHILGSISWGIELGRSEVSTQEKFWVGVYILL